MAPRQSPCNECLSFTLNTNAVCSPEDHPPRSVAPFSKDWMDVAVISTHSYIMAPVELPSPRTKVSLLDNVQKKLMVYGCLDRLSKLVFRSTVSYQPS